MICLKTVKKFCRDDISKIENYQEAINDETQTWDCHHRLELTLDGEFAHSREDLERMNMYRKRPYFELIFLKHSEHISLHSKGKTFSEESKQKMSESHKGQIAWNKGKPLSEEHKQKMRENHGGGVTQHSEETKKRMSESHKGQVAWNKGKKCSPHSEETKQKTRESMKLYWAKKRTLKIAGINPDLSLF